MIDFKDSVYCSHCGLSIYKGHIDANNNAICDKCYNTVHEGIHSYSFTPEIIFFGRNYRRNELFYGLELEFNFTASGYSNNKDKGVELVNKLLKNRAYLKHDPTVSGFELVTQPHTTTELFKLMPTFKKLFEGLKALGFSTGSNTGLHIHVSTKGVDKANADHKTLEKRLISTVLKFKTEFKLLSRRSGYSDSMYSFGHSKTENMKDAEVLRLHLKNDRYNFINLENEHTIEFRFFESTLNVNDLFGSIYLVDGLITAVKNNNNKQTFLEFKNWEYLRDMYLNKNKIITQYINTYL